MKFHTKSASKQLNAHGKWEAALEAAWEEGGHTIQIRGEHTKARFPQLPPATLSHLKPSPSHPDLGMKRPPGDLRMARWVDLMYKE